jgi:hypothetical protein
VKQKEDRNYNSKNYKNEPKNKRWLQLKNIIKNESEGSGDYNSKKYRIDQKFLPTHFLNKKLSFKNIQLHLKNCHFFTYFIVSVKKQAYKNFPFILHLKSRDYNQSW